MFHLLPIIEGSSSKRYYQDSGYISFFKETKMNNQTGYLSDLWYSGKKHYSGKVVW